MSKNRGMLLESIINKTISLYKENKIGLFHKKELPIAFSSIHESKGILEVRGGKVLKKSTSDYYGVLNGKFVAFEAKSTKLNSLPLVNIKEHQLNYLNEVEKYGGVSFFIVAFQKYDEYYIIWPSTIKNLNRASLPVETARKKGILLELIYPGVLDFADKI